MYFATKADIINSLESHQSEVISFLKTVYDTPDDTAYRVVSGSEDTGDVVYEEIEAPLPRWKRLGFTTRAEIKDFIGDYPDDNLNTAKAKKIMDHQAHISQSIASYNARVEEAIRIEAKAQAIIDNLPTWAEIDAAITAATTIAGLKVIIRKMARVLYWLAKDRAD